MIMHVLRFAFRDEATPADRDEVLRLMRRTASVESVAFSVVGRDLGDPAAGYTHGYVVGFEDLAALARYMHDPVHLAGDPDIVPHFAKLMIGPDVTDDADTELRDKIQAMHLDKIARYPEWGALMETVPEVRIA